MSAWLKHVMIYYHDRKKTDKNYKYSQAMKDARPSYKGQTGTVAAKSHKKSHKRSHKKSHKKRKTKRRKH